MEILVAYDFRKKDDLYEELPASNEKVRMTYIVNASPKHKWCLTDTEILEFK